MWQELKSHRGRRLPGERAGIGVSSFSAAAAAENELTLRQVSLGKEDDRGLKPFVRILRVTNPVPHSGQQREASLASRVARHLTKRRQRVQKPCDGAPKSSSWEPSLLSGRGLCRRR